MMGDGFGDEIGKSLIRFMVGACAICVAVGCFLYIVLGWFVRHIAINWK